MNNSETPLLDLGDFMKQGVGYAVSNSGKIIAAITFTVAALATFANVTFASVGGEAFTITLALMMMSSYIIYFSLEDAGEREGSETKEYSDARENFLAVKSRISPDDIEPLREFCLEYSESELSYRRRNYLCENGLTIKDLEAFDSGKTYSFRAKRALRRAGRMRAVKLSVARLLSTARGASQSDLAPPERNKILSTLLSLAPSTVCTFFTVSIILTTKSELTASVIIDGLIKLSALPIIGFKGYAAGYNYARGTLRLWTETKSRLLDAFLKSNP
jgi:hypothetical protein